MQLQGLKTLKIMARRVGPEDAELLTPLASSAASCAAQQQLRTELARALGPLACQTAAGVSSEAAAFLLELARDSDFEVAGAAFGSLADVGGCPALGGLHGELVSALLEILEIGLSEDADAVVDASVTLTPYVESMSGGFGEADRASELLARALSVTPRALKPLTAIAASFRESVLPFVWTIADAIMANMAEGASDEGFSCAAEAFPSLMSSGFDAELASLAPQFVELASLGLAGSRGAIALKAGSAALLELRLAGVGVSAAVLPDALTAMAAQFVTLEDEADLAPCALAFLDFAAALLGECSDAAPAAIALSSSVCEAFQASDIDVAMRVLCVLQALAALSPALPSLAVQESPAIAKTLRKMRAFNPAFAREIMELAIELEPGDGSP